MEYRVVVGALGAFYAEGLDPKDTACISPFNTIYGEQTPIMQFTGLLDKNGKEIYEGDIFRFFSTSFEATLTMEIKWPFDPTMLDCEGEVIGNIYEHPDLLK